MNKLHLPPRTIFPLILMLAVLILAILACGTGAGAPAGAQPTQSLPEQPVETQPPSILNLTALPTQPAATAIPAIPERRRLTLEYPPRIRTGDSDVVRMTLEMDDLGNITPTAMIGGNIVSGEVIEIPNLYETHHVIAEAKFDIAGMQVSPSDLFSQTLLPGQTVTFYWSVRPQEAGIYRGTIWLYLRFVNKSNAEESRKTVSAQIVEIKAVNFFGLPVNLVRGVGAVGSVVGTVVGFPFLEDIVKFIFKRRNRIRN